MSYARSASGASGGFGRCGGLSDFSVPPFVWVLKISVPGLELSLAYQDMEKFCCFGAGCSDVSPTFDQFPRCFFGTYILTIRGEFLKLLSINFVFESLIGRYPVFLRKLNKA